MSHFRPLAALLLSILFSAFLTPALAGVQYSQADEHGRHVYLVTFAEPGLLDRHRQQRSTARFDARTPEMLAARDQLRLAQEQHQVAIAAALGREARPSHHFLVTKSGVALRLTEAEARQVLSLPQVVAVEREKLYELSTYRGPTFIGADSIWSGASTPGGVGLEGAGMIAAILDTGIPAAAHASFNNDPACGHGDTFPNKVLSSLDCASTDIDGLCNGASPGDTNGHGSHTASTVAGNRIDSTASPSPTIPGSFTEISGVAPCAHIRSYKTCPTNSCPQANLVAGLNSVLLHGDVDAVNYSISGGQNPWADNDRIKLDMVDSGIFVAASAGNTSAGVPNPVGQVNHRGPWVMSVAASTRDTNTSGGSAQGDVLAGFSLRGPTPAPLQDLQKPDITAPGVSIYAAVPNGYDFISGTSMSGPHVAGAGLLVAQANPDWTPSEVKSALQMTAFKNGFKENGSTSWDADDVGSGRADLTRAALAGLVMDETFANYLAANPGDGGDVKTLNTPSVRNLDCTPVCTFTRTVRNTLSDPSSWTVSGSGLTESMNIQVVPSSFSFTGDTAETQELTITVSADGDLTSTIAFGEIVFEEVTAQSPDLHITVAITGVGGPGMALDPESFEFFMDQDAIASQTLTITSIGTDPLIWEIDEANPDSAAYDLRNVDPGLDEVLSLADFSLLGSGSHSDTATGGVTSQSQVLGFTFQGSVTGITGNGTWASDLVMTITSPDSIAYTVGGFSTGNPPWDFQGSGSDSDGTYSSTHIGSDVFGAAGAQDVGTWGFGFGHTWNDTMNWSNVTVTLHKAEVVCEDITEISWLSVDVDSGTTAPGESDFVEVTVDTTGLSLGVHEAQLCVSSNDSTRAMAGVPVTVHVFDGAPPMIDVAPASLDETVFQGSVEAFDLTVANLGESPLDWEVDETGGSCALPTWLSVDPDIGSVPGDDNQVIAVIVASGALDLGEHNATICLASNDPNTPLVMVPVTITVDPDPNSALIEGTVTGLGYCDDEPAPAAGASIAIHTSGGTVNTSADGAGFYSVYVDADLGPVDIDASAGGHLPDSVTGIDLVAQQTSVVDFGLVLAASCATVSPTELSGIVGLGGNTSLTLTIGNENGGADLNWETDVDEAAPTGYQYGLAGAGALTATTGYDRSSGLADPGRGSNLSVIEAGVQGGPIAESWSEGFEDITLLPGAGWSLQNLSTPLGTRDWFQGNDTVFPAHQGPATSYIAANFNNTTGGTGTISNWLITPEIVLHNGTELRFWTRVPAGSTWPDRLEVRLSTSGSSTNVGDFDTVMLTVNPGLAVGGYPEIWTEFVVEVEGLPASTSGRFGLRYYVTNAGPTGTNSNYIGIDTLSVNQPENLTCVDPVEVPWLSVNPISGTTAAGATSQVSVEVDGSEVQLGMNEAVVCVTTDDAQAGLFIVPVSIEAVENIADVSLADTVQPYTGSPLEVTVITDPPGLAHEVTYDGLATAPSAIGLYDVEVTVTEPGWAGGVSGTFEIVDSGPQDMVIAVHPGGHNVIHDALTPYLEVHILDAAGDHYTVDNDTVIQVTFAVNPTGAQLTGTLSTTVVNGVAVFDDLHIDLPGSGYRLLVTDAGGEMPPRLSSTFEVLGDDVFGDRFEGDGSE